MFSMKNLCGESPLTGDALHPFPDDNRLCVAGFNRRIWPAIGNAEKEM
jgi:hypothetical protein